MFHDYVQNYSHWAYADIDVLVGMTNLWWLQVILRSYDVFTVSFGDNHRIYVRGQLAIFKNTDFLKGLWKDCKQYTHLHERLIQYRDSKIWRFESVEGCFSKSVLISNASVYIASIELSDAIRAPLQDRESYFIDGHLIRCYDDKKLYNYSLEIGKLISQILKFLLAISRRSK